MLNRGVGPEEDDEEEGLGRYLGNWRLERLRGVINYERTLLVFLFEFITYDAGHMRSTNVPTGAFLL